MRYRVWNGAGVVGESGGPCFILRPGQAAVPTSVTQGPRGAG